MCFLVYPNKLTPKNHVNTHTIHTPIDLVYLSYLQENRTICNYFTCGQYLCSRHQLWAGGPLRPDPVLCQAYKGCNTEQGLLRPVVHQQDKRLTVNSLYWAQRTRTLVFAQKHCCFSTFILQLWLYYPHSHTVTCDPVEHYSLSFPRVAVVLFIKDF